MPKHGGRRARLSAQERAELQAFRLREAEATAKVKAEEDRSRDLVRSDWLCLSCGYSNFGRNVGCRRCAQPRSNLSKHIRGNYNSATVPPSYRVPRVQTGSRGGQFSGVASGRLPPHPVEEAQIRGAGSSNAAPTLAATGTARRQPGRCYADALRSPPREFELDQEREGNRGPERRVESNRGAAATEGPVPTTVHEAEVHAIGTGDSVVDELEEQIAEDDRGPLTAKKLASRIRNLEAKKEKREKKLEKQQLAIDEHNEYLEEQHRKLNTLVFELADTREDIAAIDDQIKEASRLHSELNAARSAEFGLGEDGADEGDEQRVSTIVQQVIAAMRINGCLRTGTLHKIVSSLMLEADFGPGLGPQHTNFEEQCNVRQAKKGRLASRSPAPRTPPLAGVRSSEGAQPAVESPSQSTHRPAGALARSPASEARGSGSAACAGAQPYEQPKVPCQQIVPAQGSPQAGPTPQMQKQAQAALQSDDMWEDGGAKAGVDEAISQAVLAVSASGVGGPAPNQSTLASDCRRSALAICDRASSEGRARRHVGGSHSPVRSRDRKDLYKELNERVESQKQATSRGRQ